MSGLSTRDWRGTAAVHEAVVIYISPAWRGRSCPVAHKKLSSFIKAPKPEIQSGICCSLPTCSGTLNSSMCKRISTKKTNFKKSFLTNMYFFSSPSISEDTVQLCFSPAKSCCLNWLQHHQLCLQCANLLCVGAVAVPRKIGCVLQCGGINQTGLQWCALQRPTVEQLLLVC